MRLRFRAISYTVGRTPASLERHYRELREAMLRAGQHYGLQPAMPWRPPIDIHETPDAIQVKIELAGVREEDVDVTLYDNALVVSGQRDNDVDPAEFVYYHEAQVRYGPFRADILLASPVEHDAVQATYEHGFLRVRLPKAAPSSIGQPHGGAAEQSAGQSSRKSAEESAGAEGRIIEAAPSDATASNTGAASCCPSISAT